MSSHQGISEATSGKENEEKGVSQERGVATERRWSRGKGTGSDRTDRRRQIGRCGPVGFLWEGLDVLSGTRILWGRGSR